jgi:hypothetical protein
MKGTCYICHNHLAEKEGLVSNVDKHGRALAEGGVPIIVCGESCKAAFEKTLPSRGRPIIHISRITGYYQIVEHWNKGKQQEFFDRKRYSISEL